MAENTLSARIKLKYDTLENWNNSTLVLKAGEAAVATVPATMTDTGLMPPAIGIKIGDGVNNFSKLSWIQAIAGDVYAWAKEATKPTYSTEEIDGLSDALDSNDTVYQLVRGTEENNHIIYLQSKSKSDEDSQWGIASTIDLSTLFDAKQDVLVFNTAYNASTNKVATMADVAAATASLTGAMHFIGISTAAVSDGGAETPIINGTIYENFAIGDVILYNDGTNPIAKEFVWTGEAWELLGDEGSYAIKGSIINADIAEDAAIDISKINNLTNVLDGKTNDEELARIAKTGDVEDLVQESGTILVFDCGTATTVI